MSKTLSKSQEIIILWGEDLWGWYERYRGERNFKALNDYVGRKAKGGKWVEVYIFYGDWDGDFAVLKKIDNSSVTNRLHKRQLELITGTSQQEDKND